MFDHAVERSWLNRFCAMELNTHLAQLSCDMADIIMVATFNMIEGKIMVPEKSDYIIECPIENATRHAWRYEASVWRP